MMVLGLFFLMSTTRYPDTPGTDQFADFRTFRISRSDPFNGIMTLNIVSVCPRQVPASAE